jgi:hypothetical protein
LYTLRDSVHLDDVSSNQYTYLPSGNSYSQSSIFAEFSLNFLEFAVRFAGFGVVLSTSTRKTGENDFSISYYETNSLDDTSITCRFDYHDSDLYSTGFITERSPNSTGCDYSLRSSNGIWIALTGVSNSIRYSLYGDSYSNPSFYTSSAVFVGGNRALFSRIVPDGKSSELIWKLHYVKSVTQCTQVTLSFLLFVNILANVFLTIYIYCFDYSRWWEYNL